MLSKQARRARLDELFRVKAATEGEITELLCEEERTESFRDEGATSTETWTVERYGVATATARALTHVGTKARHMPKLVGALRAGDSAGIGRSAPASKPATAIALPRSG